MKLAAFLLPAAIFIIAALFLLFRRRHPRRRAVSGRFTWANQSETNMKTLHLNGAASTASVTYTNKEGGAAPIVGVPTWSASPDGIVSLAPAADGLSAVVTPVALGQATITVVAEGDETAGVDTITLTGDVTVAAEEATGGTLAFS